MTARRTIAGIAASLLVFSAAACSPQTEPATPAAPPATQQPQTEQPQTEQPQSAEPETNDTASAAPGTPAGSADPETRNAGALQALSTAADAVSGTPYEIDDEDGDQVWEVDVLAGDRKHEVKVSWDGRNVVGQEEDDPDAEDARRLEGAGLSLGQAIERALDEVPGALDDAELDDDNDLAVWKVEIDTPDADGIEVLIKVADGQVVRVDR